MNLFFQIQNLQPLIFCMDDQELQPISIMLFYVFFGNIVKVNHLLYYFIILANLISTFLHTRSLLVPSAYASTGSVGCILLSSLALNAVLLPSSVNTLCFSLLNLCCDFNISLLFFINYLRFS